MRYRKPGIYLQYTVLPVHIDIDLYSTIGHVYGDYELTCGVTSMRPSSKQQDLSLQCRCLATPLRAAAGRKPRMMATCHHPQQRYLRSSGINFFPPSRTWKPKCPFPFLFFCFLFFLFFFTQQFTQVGYSVIHNIVAGGTVIAQSSAKALMSRRQIVHVHIGEHIYGVDIKTP